jgi:O-antigen ligase
MERTMSSLRSATAFGYGAAVAAAALLGALVAAVPSVLAFLLVVVAAGAVGIGLLRSVLRSSPDAVGHAVGETVAVNAFRASRLVFYAATAAIGFLTVRPAASFTASDWLYFVAFGLVCAGVLTARGQIEYLLPRSVTIGAALFALGGIVSSIGAVAPNASLEVVLRVVYLTLAWFWLATIVLRSRAQLETAVLVWVISASLSASGAVAQFFYGPVIPGGDVHWGRMTGFTPHFNNLGGLAATAFVPALMLATDSRRRSWRLIAVCCLLLLVAGMMLAGSVGGFLAAVVSTIVWLALRGVTARTVTIFVVAALAGVWLVSAVGYTNAPSPLKRVVSVTSKDVPENQGGTLYSRLDVYGAAWDRIERQPFVGVGLDPESSERALDSDLAVHNIIINPWFSAGLLGLVGVCLLLTGVVGTALELVRDAAKGSRSLETALFSSLVAFLLFSMGEPILFVRYGWLPSAMLLALRAQALRKERAAGSTAVEPRPAQPSRYAAAPLALGPRAR